ncbi:MAG: hypothetical protein U0804_05595 [Gemmataceae bacterium]
MRCHDCQPLLLDHLYGLLEPAQAAALDAHLTTCAGCAAARAEEARAAGLFAKAARHSFPQVRFVPPADAVPSSLDKPAARERVWGRWAVAAAVWALVPATLIPMSRVNEEAAARRGPADAAFAEAGRSANIVKAVAMQQRAAEARYAAARGATADALASWAAAERAADTAAKARPAEVTVTRPASVQPGAPNDFVVALRPNGDALAGRSVAAEVRTAAGAVVYTQALNPKDTNQEHKVRVPADVWKGVAPGAELVFAVSATAPGGVRSDLLEPVRLFGPVYATMLVTDRAAYRPGETVRFRSLTLDRATFLPPPHEQALAASLRKRDGTEIPGTTVYGTTGLVRTAGGATIPVLGPDGRPVRGVGVGEVVLPAELPEGEYLLTLAEVPGRGGRSPAMTAPVTRTVRVESGATGRFQKTITFDAAVGPKTTATVQVKSGGNPVGGATVDAVATADGSASVLVKVLDKKTDAAGKARIELVLPGPAELPRGDARLRVTVSQGGVAESVAARIPVAGKDVVVEFFPEGGTLVAGVPNRVYVRATSVTGVHVGVQGTVTGPAGPVAKVEEPAREALTARGLGVITFTPAAGARYALALDERGGKTFDLPAAAADGVAMTVLDPVTTPGQAVRVKLVSVGGPRNLVVGAYTRGRLSDTTAVAAKANEPVELTLLAGADARGGVVRLTVFEDGAGLRPVAERLAFRRPAELLKLDLKPVDAGSPGETKLHVAATDEKGNPAAAVVWAAAVASASAPGAKDRSLPTHFLLAGEVEAPDDLEHADFLLTDHPQAAAGLDLVLATQGWRRFAEQGNSPVAQRAKVDRLLAMTGSAPVGPEPARVYESHWPQYEAAVDRLQAAQAERTAASANVAGLVAAYEARRRETAALAAAANEATAGLVAARGWVSVGAVLLAVLAAGAAVVGYVRPKGVRGLVPLCASAAGAGLLALTLSEMASGSSPPDYALAELDAPPAASTGAPPSPPVAPPPQVAKVNARGQVEPPESPFFSSVGAQKLGPKTTPDKTPPAPGVTIPDSEIAPPRPIGVMRMSAPAPAVRSHSAAAPVEASADGPHLGQAAKLAGPIAVMLADVKDPDAALERMRAAVPWVPPLAVREFAAPRPAPGDAHPDTVLWRPLIVLPTDGTTTLSFFPDPAAGGYEVVVAGHTLDGRIGTVRRVVPGTRD